MLTTTFRNTGFLATLVSTPKQQNDQKVCLNPVF